jgi:uncharacterized tellurite resistance protein B-like protein
METAMFDALTRIFSKPDTAQFHNEPRLAVAALLVHLAAVDGTVTDDERRIVRETLEDYYGLEADEVEKLVVEATRRDADAVDFYQFTSALKTLDPEERVEVVRMMWQVVFADKKNDELEDNMVWRIAELIGVSARDRTVLRNQMARKI